jgi:flagellar protein FliO/FliZ
MTSSFWGLGGQVLLVLVLIIGLLFAITWFLKHSGLAQQSANGHLKILGGVSVGPRERVLLLQVGQDQILVGVTAAEITLLHMLSQPISVETDKPEIMTGFAQQLQALMRRRTENS